MSASQLHERFAALRPTSRLLHERARHHLPSGTTRTVLDYEPFPLTITSASGCRITDVDGHSYLDYLGDYSVGLAGHDPEPVRRAVMEVLDQGWAFGAVGPDEARCAKALCERFDSFDKVRFTSSGTEANLLAISLAMRATGRRALLAVDGGYHGGVLSFEAGREGLNVPYDVATCTFNDLDSVTAAFDARPGQVACVLLEPMLGSGGRIPADAAFLAGVRALCDREGAVLIFDEVQTSRLSFGGAQELLGVAPDLTTVGKYLGGGLPLGVVGGRDALMSQLERGHPGAFDHSGTFNNNRFAMAACAAVLGKIATREVLELLRERGEGLRAEVNARVHRHGFQATGWGSLMSFHPTIAPLRNAADVAAVDRGPVRELFHELLDLGVYIGKSGFVTLSVAQDDATDAAFLDAVSEAVARVALRRAGATDG
jgi:glutamate-1-semialdehyde 2,1-aminomutase